MKDYVAISPCKNRCLMLTGGISFLLLMIEKSVENKAKKHSLISLIVGGILFSIELCLFIDLIKNPMDL